MCDDTNYALRAKAYKNEALAAKVSAITTCGMYPGVSNGTYQTSRHLHVLNEASCVIHYSFFLSILDINIMYYVLCIMYYTS